MSTVMNADFPGKILEVMVKEGDTVTSGQPVLVIEAMKMENELLAPAGGTVAKIHVAANAAVNAGEALLTIE